MDVLLNICGFYARNSLKHVMLWLMWCGEPSFSFEDIEGGAATVPHYAYEKDLNKKAHQCILSLAPIHKLKLILDFDLD